MEVLLMYSRTAQVQLSGSDGVDKSCTAKVQVQCMQLG